MTTHTWRDATRTDDAEERYCRCGLRERYVRTADGVSWQWRTAETEWRERMTGDPRPICTATAEHRAAPVEGKCRIGRCRRMAEPGQSRCARCAETQRAYQRRKSAERRRAA